MYTWCLPRTCTKIQLEVVIMRKMRVMQKGCSDHDLRQPPVVNSNREEAWDGAAVKRLPSRGLQYKTQSPLISTNPYAIFCAKNCTYSHASEFNLIPEQLTGWTGINGLVSAAWQCRRCEGTNHGS